MRVIPALVSLTLLALAGVWAENNDTISTPVLNDTQPVLSSVPTPNDYRRKAPPNPIEGIVNWKRITTSGQATFTPRHSHATCVFKCPDTQNDCIWLTGGKSKPYRTYNLRYEDRRADIWWSQNGSVWNQVSDIQGEFIRGVGNYDAKRGGSVAPWYSRYGHSLDTLSAEDDSIADVMVFVGGNDPLPSNDVWLSANGTYWSFDGYAPFSKRAYHASTAFEGKLFIVGGTPLTNDVWTGTLKVDPIAPIGYRMEWKLVVPHLGSPWAPRAGHCLVTQSAHEAGPLSNTDINTDQIMYMIGGYAGWPSNDTRHDALRARNDVWVTTDGVEWTRVLPSDGMRSMAFGARTFHACTTWDANSDDSSPEEIYITGGGYAGTKGNNVVNSLEGHVDTWWSIDGSNWRRVDYQEGRQKSLYSTNERSIIYSSEDANNVPVHIGKWGHSLERFPLLQTSSGTEDSFPALFFIGGSTVDGGPIVDYVFVSRPSLLCELEGVTCSHRGVCGPGVVGCICDPGFSGEYCQDYDDEATISSSKG